MNDNERFDAEWEAGEDAVRALRAELDALRAKDQQRAQEHNLLVRENRALREALARLYNSRGEGML